MKVSFQRRAPGMAGLAALLIIASCGDATTSTPTAPMTSLSSQALGPPPGKGPQGGGPQLYFALVRADGGLAGGTAISAERIATGAYRVRFPPSIQGCAGAANSTVFQGFDESVNVVSIQLIIGAEPGMGGGLSDEEHIGVRIYDANGLEYDSSFGLTLVCP